MSEKEDPVERLARRFECLAEEMRKARAHFSQEPDRPEKTLDEILMADNLMEKCQNSPVKFYLKVVPNKEDSDVD